MNTQEFLLGLDCLKYGVNITDRNRNNRGDINEKENTKQKKTISLYRTK